MQRKFTVDDVSRVLEAIERGEITLKPQGRTAKETYAGDVPYMASNGWRVVVFNDCNSWDYLESIEAPDGRFAQYPSGLEPKTPLDEFFIGYSPPVDAQRDAYGFVDA